MNINDIKEKLKTKDYDFLRENKHLGSNIILLGLSGSYAYGTNNKESDIDIRGIATRTARDILIGHDFNNVVDINTDTTIYSFDKIIKLLCSCNPNIIEILGLKPEHYIYLNDAGKRLIKNRHLFLSKKATYSFSGFAISQFKQLENKIMVKDKKEKISKHMCHLVRLYFMFFDILEKEEIITFREKEHDLLMSIRNGDFLDATCSPTDDFYELIDSLNERLVYDKENTSLPEKVDMEKIYSLLEYINAEIVIS